jgi:hypothetical protein
VLSLHFDVKLVVPERLVYVVLKATVLCRFGRNECVLSLHFDVKLVVPERLVYVVLKATGIV